MLAQTSFAHSAAGFNCTLCCQSKCKDNCRSRESFFVCKQVQLCLEQVKHDLASSRYLEVEACVRLKLEHHHRVVHVDYFHIKTLLMKQNWLWMETFAKENRYIYVHVIHIAVHVMSRVRHEILLWCGKAGGTISYDGIAQCSGRAGDFYGR